MAQERANCAQRPVHHGHAHALPARRHAAGEFRALARGGRQGRLESGAGRQAADARRPEVQQLLQGNLPRQRHQDRADLVVAVGNPARLVPHQRDDDRGARQGEQGGRRAAHVRARDLHAGLGRLARAPRRLARAQAGIDQGLHRRRQHQQGRGQASLADGRREGHLQGLRAVREARHQERLRAQGPVPAGDRRALAAPARLRRRSTTSARPRRTGRSSTSSSITAAIATPPAAAPRTAGTSSSRPAASPGSATSPRSRRSSASPTSMPTSASCSRRASSPSRGSAPR